MDTLLKKYFWVIQVLGLAAATGLAASAVVTQIGTSFALDLSEDASSSSDEKGKDKDAEDEAGDDAEDEPLARGAGSRSAFGASSGTSASAKRADKQRIADAILTRNIFCPTCVPEGEVVEEAAEVANRPAGATKSQLPLKLMATMEASDPQYSLATIYDAQDTRTGLYGIGDALRPGVFVVGIEQAVVHLRNNARLEYIEIGEQLAGIRPVTPQITPEEPMLEPPNANAIPGAEEAINCPNENTCVVERQFVEQLMANPAQLARQARIVPSQRNGETQGFKFYGIRRDSLPRMLGLKNGDMLTSVNGEELRSVDQAMGLVLKLRRASNLSVTLVRKGETIQKEIQIQ